MIASTNGNGSSPPFERRRALTVDARVRRFYLGVLALATVEVGLIAALGVVLSRASLPRGAAGGLLIAACAIAFLASAVALGLAAYATVHVHRMAGSAFHITRALHALREEKPFEPVVLRPSDYLQEVAAEVNRLQDRHRFAASPRN